MLFLYIRAILRNFALLNSSMHTMNNDVIRLLPDSVANQIAAGEVIQRPASVIKELVENSVDAGATEISIILKDAGRTLIQVVDNGCGMSATDARMAFERHATSKISAATDLYSLHTMGFRGEALPSVAAVAQIDLRTMRKDDHVGTRILISESKFEGQEPVSCVPGTNLMVKNIFFHMPARRKFLKKDSVELSHIVREFEKLALVNTNVAFTLVHNDVTLHQFRAEPLKQRIASLFGKNMIGQLAALSTETSLVKLDGFIGMPRYAKKRGAQQFLFVNGRNMQHPFFRKAILKCYEQLIPADTQPSYFINFEVDPSTIDVNIHPQKHEIKFEHEMAIWQILEAAVRETLGKCQAAGALDFDLDDAPEIPLFDPHAEADMPRDTYDTDFNPFRPSGQAPVQQWHASEKAVPRDWDKLYENFRRARDDAYSAPAEADRQAMPGLLDEPAALAPADVCRSTCFQLQNRYIVASSHRGIMVLMQRRAHIRILFEKYQDMLGSDRLTSQALLFTEDFEVSASVGVAIESNLDMLRAFGFGLKRTGATQWSIDAVPSAIGQASPTDIILGIFSEDGEAQGDASIADRLALSMAKASAVEACRQLTQDECENIVAELMRCRQPSFTPDGQTVMAVVDNDQLQSMFA